MLQVCCLGILVADVVGKTIEAFPPKGTLAAIERMELHVGGCAASTSIALAKLGVETAVLGKIGDDGFGRFLSETLENHGVGTRGLVRDGAEATAATMVAVDGAGERTFLHYAGANAVYTAADVLWPEIEAARFFHVAGPFLMPRYMGTDNAAVLMRAKALGKTTTLDTVWDATGRWMSVLAPCLPFLDFILPSWEEARLLTGRETPEDAAQVFLDGGVKAVGLKLGAQGAYLRTAAGDELRLSALPVEAVDALGAGDCWAAGFLCGLTRGWDLERTARFANAAGACAVQALGATTGVRSFDETYALAFGTS